MDKPCIDGLVFAHNLYEKISENKIVRLEKKVQELKQENEKLYLEKTRYKNDYELLTNSLKKTMLHIQ